MSIQLIIYNLSPLLEQNQLHELFKSLKGFVGFIKCIDSTTKIFICLVEFSSYEYAENARILLKQRSHFMDNNVVLDFLREKPNIWNVPEYNHPFISLNQKIETNYKFDNNPNVNNQNPNNPNIINNIPFNSNDNMQTIPNFGPNQMVNPYTPFYNKFMPEIPPMFGNNNQRFQNQNMMYDGMNNNILFKIPSNSTSCLYVEGVPLDAKEREVSHIFRPFPGYQNSRLILKESKSGRKFYYCFVDFENNIQASICMQTVQGYKFHYKDIKGIKVSYATPTNIVKKRRKPNRSRSPSSYKSN